MVPSSGNKVAKVAPFQGLSLAVFPKQEIKMEPEEVFDPDNPGYQLVPLRRCLLCGTIFQCKGLLQDHFRIRHPRVPVGPELLEDEDENDDEDSDEDDNEVHGEEGDDMEEADEEEDVKPDIDEEYYYPSEIFRQNPYETSTLFKKTNEWVTKNLKETNLWEHYKVDDEVCSNLLADYRRQRREAAKKPVDSSAEGEGGDEKPRKNTTKKRKPRKKSTPAPVKRKLSKAAEAPKAKKKADDCHGVTPEMLELGESVRVQLFRQDWHFCKMCLKTFFSTESYMKHSHDVTPEEADRLEREKPWSILLDRCDDLALAYTRSRTALSCDHCDHIAKNATELGRHQRSCKPDYGPSGSSPSAGSSQQVNCDHCGLIVKSMQGLRRHTPHCRVLKEMCEKSSIRDPSSTLKCNGCGSTMKNMAGLRRHLRHCESGRSS